MGTDALPLNVDGLVLRFLTGMERNVVKEGSRVLVHEDFPGPDRLFQSNLFHSQFAFNREFGKSPTGPIDDIYSGDAGSYSIVSHVRSLAVIPDCLFSISIPILLMISIYSLKLLLMVGGFLVIHSGGSGGLSADYIPYSSAISLVRTFMARNEVTEEEMEQTDAYLKLLTLTDLGAVFSHDNHYAYLGHGIRSNLFKCFIAVMLPRGYDEMGIASLSRDDVLDATKDMFDLERCLESAYGCSNTKATLGRSDFAKAVFFLSQFAAIRPEDIATRQTLLENLLSWQIRRRNIEQVSRFLETKSLGEMMHLIRTLRIAAVQDEHGVDRMKEPMAVLQYMLKKISHGPATSGATVSSVL